MINYAAIAQLEKLKESGTAIESVLINLDDQSKMFTFLWVPSNWTYAASNQYQTSYGMFGKNPHTKFRNSEVGTLTINRLDFRSPCHDRNMNQVIRDLENLRLPVKDKLTPPRLSWMTGQRTIQPLYLQSLSIENTDIIDGNSTALGISLTFIGADQVTF